MDRVGSSVSAKCNCGYEAKDIFIGRGMNPRNSANYFPALCQDCNEIVSIDLGSNKRCPICHSLKTIPYDDKRLAKKHDLLPDTGQENIATWHVVAEQNALHTLSDSVYRCPKCVQLTLHFYEGGILWD